MTICRSLNSNSETGIAIGGTQLLNPLPAQCTVVGAIATAVRKVDASKSGLLNLTDFDSTVLVDTSQAQADVTVALPSAFPSKGRQVTIKRTGAGKKADGTAVPVLITATAGTVESGANLTSAFSSAILVSDGSQWWVVGRSG